MSTQIVAPGDVLAYSRAALPHLERVVMANEAVMRRIAARLANDVRAGRALLVFGSGHSSMFPMEIYHRAGGPSFMLPVVADYLMPTAGPPVVRVLERTAGVATVALKRVDPRPGEMLWLCSQSGINAAVVDLALEARKMGLYTVAFTSTEHSRAVASRHPSGQRLFEACDETVDLGGVRGDAVVEVADGTRAGPLSTLGSVLLAHSILVASMAELEQSGHRCVYTSVNTPEGEARNRALEDSASRRDFLLRG